MRHQHASAYKGHAFAQIGGSSSSLVNKKVNMKVGVLGNGGTSVFDRFSFRISVIFNIQIQKTCADLVKKLMIVIVRGFAINLF